jgi:N-methylhydantoinase B
LSLDPVAEELFRHLFVSVAEEMGVTLERSAYSPNIKERRDYSCALFDARGALIEQAAHIPVHLGAFPLLMERVVPALQWRPGDVVISNDPAAGGTHLPDISLISPVFTAGGRRAGFVANRAHHADVGGTFPGSMGPATELFQEGFVLPPVKLVERGRCNEALLQTFLRNVRTPDERRGDLQAQIAANAVGIRRFQEILNRYGGSEVRARTRAARAATAAAMRVLIRSMRLGSVEFEDALDDDGVSHQPVRIRLTLSRRDGLLVADFRGSDDQRRGCINAPPAVAHAAVYYCLLSLLPEQVAVNEAAFRQIEVLTRPGSVLHPVGSAAVAAGNVETSQRVVDVVLGCLSQLLPGRIPAASQGTMNNLSAGPNAGRSASGWAYYETLGGGAGAGPGRPGISGAHVHLSNTRNTPAEALEYHYPMRVRSYSLRNGSGGNGAASGGCGVVRELELLEEATVTLLTDRRAGRPYGLAGGEAGAAGCNELWRDGQWHPLPGKTALALVPGERVRISTPGGGGYGPPPAAPPVANGQESR